MHVHLDRSPRSSDDGSKDRGSGESAGARVLIADDHPLFRDALKGALGRERSGATAIAVVEAGSMDEAVRALEADEAAEDDGGGIDLVLLDLAMPGRSGTEGLLALRGRFPLVAVMVVSATDDATVVRRLVQLGASGFVSKSASIDVIREAVATVLAGGTWFPDVAGTEADPEVERLVAAMATLTPQQTRVLAMLAQGLLNKQIAWELSVSEATVKAHVSAVLAKLGVDSRTQAVIKVAKLGLGLDVGLGSGGGGSAGA